MEVNQKQLCEVLGLSRTQIYRLNTEKNMFLSRVGNKYDLAACVQEYIHFKLEDATSRSQAPDYWEEKAKHEHAKLEMSNIRLAKMKREMFDVSDVEEAWATLLLEFKNSMINLPFRLAPMVVSNDDLFVITEIIESEVKDMLRELARFNPDMIQSDDDMPGDDEDEKTSVTVLAKDTPDVKAGGEANRKRVGRKEP